MAAALGCAHQDILRICKACHATFHVKRRLLSVRFCLLVGVGCLLVGIGLSVHPMGKFLILVGATVTAPGVLYALRYSTRCTACHSKDTVPAGCSGTEAARPIPSDPLRRDLPPPDL